jgi:hypothetical protein
LTSPVKFPVTLPEILPEILPVTFPVKLPINPPVDVVIPDTTRLSITAEVIDATPIVLPPDTVTFPI